MAFKHGITKVPILLFGFKTLNMPPIVFVPPLFSQIVISSLVALTRFTQLTEVKIDTESRAQVYRSVVIERAFEARTACVYFDQLALESKLYLVDFRLDIAKHYKLCKSKLN